MDAEFLGEGLLCKISAFLHLDEPTWLARPSERNNFLTPGLTTALVAGTYKH